MTTTSLRLAVFASGGGSNLEAILQAIESDELKNVSVTAVISNNKNAGALTRASSRGIPTHVLAPNHFENEAAYLTALNDALDKAQVNFIALAGYLKKIPALLVKQYHNRMLNIHPSLLPAFGGAGMYGIRIHTAAINRGVRWSGATIHFVDEHYDNGPILLQKPVPVYEGDSPEQLAKRVLAVEHRLYPEALRLIAAGRVSVEDNKVLIDPQIQYS